jgi:hypothetical protein
VFAVFLFLTYYLQQSRGYSPISTGLAFLPMTAMPITRESASERSTVVSRTRTD